MVLLIESLRCTGDAAVNQSDGEQHKKDHKGKRCCRTVKLVVYHELIGLRDENFSLVTWAAIGNKADDVELVKRPDRTKHDRRNHGRTNQRERNISELLPFT